MAEKWVMDEMHLIISRQNRQLEVEEEVVRNEPEMEIIADDIWAYFDKKAADQKTYSTPSTLATIMIKQYLQMPLLERKKDPLEFWAKHKNLLPQLYELAIKYLCIPSTSVPSERVFSKTGQLTNLRRNRLSPKNLDMVIFLNSCL